MKPRTSPRGGNATRSPIFFFDTNDKQTHYGMDDILNGYVILTSVDNGKRIALKASEITAVFEDDILTNKETGEEIECTIISIGGMLLGVNETFDDVRYLIFKAEM